MNQPAYSSFGHLRARSAPMRARASAWRCRASSASSGGAFWNDSLPVVHGGVVVAADIDERSAGRRFAATLQGTRDAPSRAAENRSEPKRCVEIFGLRREAAHRRHAVPRAAKQIGQHGRAVDAAARFAAAAAAIDRRQLFVAAGRRAPPPTTISSTRQTSAPRDWQRER